jgi:hypothetical protein
MTSPRAFAKPQASALPLPWRLWVMIVALGFNRRATATVSSKERPSTTMISKTSGRRAKTIGKFNASL